MCQSSVFSIFIFYKEQQRAQKYTYICAIFNLGILTDLDFFSEKGQNVVFVLIYEAAVVVCSKKHGDSC